MVWEELFCKIFDLLSWAWRNPIYLAYVVYFGPRLLGMVVFFFPLLISTCLFMLVVFSLGPQLHRIRLEGELQWRRLREAGEILRGRGDDKEFRVMRGVKRPVMDGRDVWRDLWREMHVRYYEAGVISGDLLLNGIEEHGMKVEFDNYENGVIPVTEGKTLYPRQSVILSKIGVLLDTLVAELGGKVEYDALNALEAIAEALIETTQRQYEKEIVFSGNSAIEAGKNRVSEAKVFQILGKTADLENNDVERPSEYPIIDKGNVDMTDQEAYEEDIGAFTVHDNVFETHAVGPESLLEESCVAVKLSDSLLSGTDNVVLESDQTELSERQNGIPNPENCLFRSCRSFPVDGYEEEFPVMDRLWEDDSDNIGLYAIEKTPVVRKEKDWKRTLACKLFEEHQNGWKKTLAGKFFEERSGRFESQSSSPANIPELRCYTELLSGKSTSSSSDSPAFTSVASQMDAEEMDHLWEEYNDAQSEDTESQIKGLSKSLAKLRSLRGNADSDVDDGPETPKLCCLKAFRFSPGRMPLRKPNLVKFSKALKNFGFMQHIRGSKHHIS